MNAQLGPPDFSLPILYELLIDRLPVNIFIIDERGYLVWGNQRMLETLKLTLPEPETEPLGQHVSLWGVWDSCQEILEENREQVTQEIGSNHRIYLTSKTPFERTDQSGGRGIIGISLDITEQKQAELVEQSFIMNMAHDIRTPLAGIIGLSQLQEAGVLSSMDETQSYGRMIRDSATQLLELLNAVMKVIDTEHMADPVNTEALDLSGLARELEALITPSIYTKGLKFQSKIDKNIPVILSDRIKLKRILINLLSNSVKFTKEGQIYLSVKLLSSDQDWARVEIRITDTGIGIPKDKLDKIFDRFYRAHPAYQTQYAGHGIGLYLVKETLGLLNGEIEVLSEEGKGSCFILHLTFPVMHAATDAKKTAYTPPKTRVRAAPTPENSILIVEDNLLIQYAEKALLNRMGYTVKIAVDGKSALSMLKKHTFTWMLLDLGLPDLSGTEIIRQYRLWEHKKNRTRLPIFVLTAHGIETVEKECREAGIDGVFVKPLTPAIVQKILTRVAHRGSSQK